MHTYGFFLFSFSAHLTTETQSIVCEIISNNKSINGSQLIEARTTFRRRGPGIDSRFSNYKSSSNLSQTISETTSIASTDISTTSSKFNKNTSASPYAGKYKTLVPSGVKVIDQSSSNKSSHALNRSLPSSSNHKFSLASSIKNYNIKNKSNNTNSLRSSSYVSSKNSQITNSTNNSKSSSPRDDITSNPYSPSNNGSNLVDSKLNDRTKEFSPNPDFINTASTYNNSNNNNNPFFNETTTNSSVQTNDNVSSFKSRLPRSSSNVSQGSVGILEFPRSHSRSRIPTKTTSSGGSRPESRCSGLSK